MLEAICRHVTWSLRRSYPCYKTK